jgi:hypothetical protein
VHTPDSRIGVGIWWEAIKFEAIRFIGDSTIHRLELISLKWPVWVDISVMELDDDPLVLDTADRELVVGKWCNQRRVFRELV